jgi:peptide/nickel transport system substrate-binding protein
MHPVSTRHLPIYAFALGLMLSACAPAAAPPAPTAPSGAAKPTTAPAAPPAPAPTAAAKPTAPTAAPLAATSIPVPAPAAAAASGAAHECVGLPAEARGQDLTLTAAYAASPPALDEIAFTLEVENVLSMTYSGDLMQYKPVWSDQFNVCIADMTAAGDTGVIGRWADKWDSSDNGTTWTFHLRPGIKSWRGNEMTSDDILWTWQRAFEMKAARYFSATVMFLQSPNDVTAVDRYTVRFHTQQPSPVFLKLMAMNYYGGIFDSVEAKKHATADDPWAKEWLKSNDAGFGPYHIVKNVPGQELNLERNANFQPTPPIGKIFIKIVPDAATRLALLQRGEVDYAMRLPERSLQALKDTPSAQVVRYTANYIPYVGPVETNEIMANAKVRQAMAYTVPYEDIYQKVYFGQGTLIKSITPAIFPNYTSEFWPYTFDPAKAKQMLTDAGYPDGFDLKLSYDNSIVEMAEAAVLVKGAFDNVGIRTTLDPLPAAVYSERKLKRQLMCQIDNFQWPWVADTGYTSWVYLGNPDTNVNNSVFFNDPEFNSTVTEMMHTPYGPDRLKMDLRAQQIVGEQAPWIFLVNPGWREAMKKEWTNLHWYPDVNVHFEWLYKTK